MEKSKKSFQTVVPKSASAAVPVAGMRLEDFALSNERLDHLNESLAPTLAERSIEPPPVPAQNPPARITKMIATPIDAALRKTLRELRNDYEISEAFTVETALREYFSARPLAEIAAELRERGGRLRRSKT